MESKNWYVVRTKSKSEKAVSTRLTKLGIDHYLPLHRVLKRWHDRKKYVEEVLIKGFVFVYLEERRRAEVFQVAGITHYLFVHKKIAIISDAEIARIKFFCTLADTKINKKPEKGDRVEVISGHLIGLQGHIVSSSTGERLQIHLPALGCFASLVINKADVCVIDPKQAMS
jgi:transcription antitermination factor NusG